MKQLLRKPVQHCVNNDEFSACSLRQRRVVVSQRCHRIASLLRLALTQISGADIHRYLSNSVLAPASFLLLLLLFWEGAARLFRIPLYVLPSPLKVLQALIAELPALFAHGQVTVSEAAAGIAISLALALLLGITMDCFPLFRQGLYPVFVVTQTVPMIVLAPILIIYMGFGATPKILTVVLMCFFPVVVSFSDGLSQVNEESASRPTRKWQAYRLVKIPAALPSLLSGLKVAATYSISGAVVGEWIGSQEGLGYYLLRVKNSYMLDKVFACVLVIIFLSLCMNGLIRLFQRAAMPYLKKAG